MSWYETSFGTGAIMGIKDNSAPGKGKATKLYRIL